MPESRLIASIKSHPGQRDVEKSYSQDPDNNKKTTVMDDFSFLSWLDVDLIFSTSIGLAAALYFKIFHL